MLHLIFDIGEDSFAMPSCSVVEVLPYIKPKNVRDAPQELCGSILYRGRFIPLVDLRLLLKGVGSELRMGTRIAVVSTMSSAASFPDMNLGIILENATEVLALDDSAFTPFALSNRGYVQQFILNDTLFHKLEGSLRIWAEMAAC